MPSVMLCHTAHPPLLARPKPKAERENAKADPIDWDLPEAGMVDCLQ